MAKTKLVLNGDKKTPVEGEEIILDVWRGKARIRIMYLGEWVAFSKKESTLILDFFKKAIKELKK